MSARSLRRDGHAYTERGHAPCPRLVISPGWENEECDGLVPISRRGEADDVNDYNGGTPGWEEMQVGACPSCGASDWTEQEEFALAGSFQRDEPDTDA